MGELNSFNTVNGKYCCNEAIMLNRTEHEGFNTVNGKYCCNNLAKIIKERYCLEFQYRKR